MQSYEMLRGLVLVITYVSEERSASIIRVTRVGELRTTLAVTSNRRTLRRNAHIDTVFLHYDRLLVTGNVYPSSPIFITLIMEAIRSSETSVFTRAPRCNPRSRHYSLSPP
jgi:hypothetical protein